MAEFGQPARNATTDANAGVINPPAQKTTARTVAQPQQKQQITTLDTGVQSFGASMGEALAGQIEKREEFIEANHAMDLEVEAAYGTAARSMEELDDATGWTDAFAGPEAVETRSLQQRASVNVLRDESLKIHVNIEQYAGMNEEEFKRDVLKDGLDSMLEKHKGDEQSRRILAHAWIKESGKLAARHKKEMSAFNQIQSKELARHGLRTTSDIALSEAGDAQTPSEAADARKPMLEMYGKGTPVGLTQKSWDILRFEEVGYSLQQGNVGAFNAATQAGFFTGKSADAMHSLDKSARVYSEKLTREAAGLRNSVDVQANRVRTVDEVVALYDQLQVQLEEIETRKIKGFGPTRIDNEQQKADATERQYITRYSPSKAELAAAKKAAADKEADDEELQTDMAAVQNRGNNNFELLDRTMSKKRIGAAQDAWLKKGLREEFGEAMDEQEMLGKVLTTDAGLAAATKHLGQGYANSPILQTIISTAINGSHDAFKDATDQKRFTPEATAMVGRLETIKKFTKIPSELLPQYHLMVNAITANRSVDRYEKDRQALAEAAEKPSTPYQPVYFDKKAQSKFEHVKQLLTTQLNDGRKLGFFGKDQLHPTRMDIAEAMEVYATGLKVGHNDAVLAGEYLNDYLANSQEQVKIGSTIHSLPNISKLVEGTGERQPITHDVGEILDYAARKNKLLEPIKGIRGNTETASDPTPILSLAEIPNLQVTSVLGRDAIILNTVASPVPYPLEFDQLRLWDFEMTQKANEEKLEASDRALARTQASQQNRRRR